MKIGIIAVIIIGAIAAVFVGSSKEKAEVVDTREAESVEQDEMMDDSEMNEMETEKVDDVDIAEAGTNGASQGTYTDYSPEKVAQAEGDIVLFFHASWCPSCRAQDADILENESDIPANVTILKVDYDSSTALKQKHGVTTQHTFVQVDNEGGQITKWIGGSTLEQLVGKIQ